MSMATRTRQRRRQLDRAGIAARTGMSPATVDYWYHHRASTRFPDKADTDADGRDWWWQDDIDTFHTTHLQRRAASFTQVDRSGDPWELLGAPQAARVLGYRNHRSLPDELIHNPDQRQELPSGRLRRKWYRQSVWDYADGRPLRHSTGRPPGTSTGPGQPHWYTEDPRLDAALALLAEAEAAGARYAGLGVELARRLRIQDRTAQRLISAARTHRALHACQPGR